ncbi:MAG: glycosyltransferase family 1 protein [Myxococcales bacterium]|nr:glycosyltransferase family 1 protein [Myxococcales bacterium]
MRRVAFSMTIDPDGAMHDWVDLPDGWSLVRVPTQEAIHLIGITAYQALVIDLCARERIDVLVTHPPYDYLSPSVAERIRGSGTRIVGYAFDDEIFAAGYDASTRSAIAQIYDRYATTREVRWATAPLPALQEAETEYDVVLAGRAYARREAMVAALRAAGLRVAVRGHGWPEGFASRAEMCALYARAAVVLTTADWESRAVPMVKHRLLDAAMLGAFQVAQEAPDLRAYFSVDEVPSFADAGELIARVREALADPEGRRKRALAARQRALAEHTWQHRFLELIAPLALGPERPPPATEERSLLLDQLLCALASRAESTGRPGAAAALYRERLVRDATDAGVAAGLGRCLRDLDQPDVALPWLRAAAAADYPTCAAAVHATVPSFGVGTGLGRLGLLPPAVEPTVFLIATLVEIGRPDEAAAVLDAIAAPLTARAVAATITIGDDGTEPLRAALARALTRQ